MNIFFCKGDRKTLNVKVPRLYSICARGQHTATSLSFNRCRWLSDHMHAQKAPCSRGLVRFPAPLGQRNGKPGTGTQLNFQQEEMKVTALKCTKKQRIK